MINAVLAEIFPKFLILRHDLSTKYNSIPNVNVTHPIKLMDLKISSVMKSATRYPIINIGILE